MARQRKDRIAKLNIDKLWFLNTGFYLDGVPLKNRFKDEKEIRAAWGVHKAEILQRWRDEGRAGRRPWVWWIIERGIDPVHDLGSGYFKEEFYLIEHGLIEDWEAAKVEKQKNLYENTKRRKNHEKRRRK